MRPSKQALTERLTNDANREGSTDRPQSGSASACCSIGSLHKGLCTMPQISLPGISRRILRANLKDREGRVLERRRTRKLFMIAVDPSDVFHCYLCDDDAEQHLICVPISVSRK